MYAWLSPTPSTTLPVRFYNLRPFAASPCCTEQFLWLAGERGQTRILVIELLSWNYCSKIDAHRQVSVGDVSKAQVVAPNHFGYPGLVDSLNRLGQFMQG